MVKYLKKYVERQKNVKMLIRSQIEVLHTSINFDYSAHKKSLK